MICNKCNHKLPDDSEFCQYCGNKIESVFAHIDVPAEKPDKYDSPTENTANNIMNNDSINDNNFSAIERAFILLELKEWKKADEIFEELLSGNPKMSEVYLGKCMIDLHITDKKSIIKNKQVLKNKNFELALRFSTGAQKSFLESIANQLTSNVKQEKAKSKKLLKRIVLVALVLIICTSLVFAGLFVYKKVLNPMMRYKQAEKLVNDGNYYEAIKVYSGLKSYKDSEKLYVDAKYKYALKLYNDKDFAECAKWFIQVKDYKDCDTYLQKPEVFWRTKGNVITFGSYEQDNNFKNGKEKIEWIILDPEYSSDSIMLISKKCLDYKMYDENNHCVGLEEDEVYNQFKDAGVSWQDCTLRSWLNNSFYNDTFTLDEKDRLQNIEITNDKISILSAKEAEKLFDKTVQMSTGETIYAYQRLTDTYYNGKRDPLFDKYSENYVIDYWLRKTETSVMQDIVIAESHIGNASIYDDRGEIQKDAALSMSPIIAVRPVIVVNIKQ